MGHMIVRQPSGRLAIFSSIVDNFIVVNATEVEIMEELLEDTGRRQAAEMIEHGKEDWLPYRRGVKGDGLARWRYAINLIRMNHGQVGVSNMLKFIYGKRLRRRLPIEYRTKED